jgi:hypothetical protein
MTVLLVLILAAGMASRTHRLIVSHTYLQEGVYSFDRRYDGLERDLDAVEAALDARFTDLDEAKAYFASGKKIIVNTYTLAMNTLYNESVYLSVTDSRNASTRDVELFREDRFILKIRGI